MTYRYTCMSLICKHRFLIASEHHNPLTTKRNLPEGWQTPGMFKYFLDYVVQGKIKLGYQVNLILQNQPSSITELKEVSFSQKKIIQVLIAHLK